MVADRPGREEPNLGSVIACKFRLIFASGAPNGRECRPGIANSRPGSMLLRFRCADVAHNFH